MGGGYSLLAQISRQMVELSSSRSKKRRDGNIKRDAALPAHSETKTGKHVRVTEEERRCEGRSNW